MSGARRGRWLLLVGLLGCPLAACPTPSIFGPVEFAPPPPELASNPTGAVVLLKEGTIAFAEPARAGESGSQVPSVVVSERYRIRVTGKAHESVTRWRVAHALATRIELARGRLARPDGSVVEIDALPGGTVPKGDVLLELPSANPGDVIDVFLRRTILVAEALPPWSFAGPAPAAESRLMVTAPVGWDVRIRVGTGDRLDRSSKVRPLDAGGGRQGWTIVEQNVRAVPAEAGGVHPQWVAPWATVVLAGAVLDGTLRKYADSWATVARRVQAMLAQTMDLDEEHARQMRRGSVKARLRQVRRAIRPAASNGGLFDHPIRPFARLAAGGASPLETAAVAAAAMVDAVEEAHLALVAPFAGPVLIDDLPGLYAFRGAVLALRAADSWTFAAPACSTCPLGKVPIRAAGGRALVMTPEGATIVDIPFSSVEPNRVRLQFDWTVSVDGDITGSLLADLEGFTAQQAFRTISDTGDDVVRNRLLTDLLLGAGAGCRVEGVVQSGVLEPGVAYPLKVRIRGTATKTGDGRLLVTPATLAGLSFPWGLPASRQTALLLPAPLRVEVTGALRLPPDYGATLPAKSEERLPFGEASFELSRSGRVITYRRRFGLFARGVPAKHYSELMTFLTRINKADNTAILIRPED